MASQPDTSSPDQLPVRRVAGEGYPPETYHLMSWSAIAFIHRPHPRAIGWITLALFALIAAMVTASFFLTVDSRVEAVGQIEAEPAIVGAASESDGVDTALHAAAGAAVTRGEVLASLEMDVARADIEETIAGLDRNGASAAEPSTGARAGESWETGRRVERVRDPAVGEAIGVLEDAVRRVRSMAADAPVAAETRGHVRHASLRLANLLRGHLDRRLVRAPVSGTLLQFHGGVGSRAHAQEVLATIQPEGARLVVVMTVESRSLPALAVGQRAQHILDAYPYQQYGLFGGAVLAIEPMAARTDEPRRPLRYRIISSIDEPVASSASRPAGTHGAIRLVVGMSVRSSIITERRTLYEAGLRTFFSRG